MKKVWIVYHWYRGTPEVLRVYKNHKKATSYVKAEKEKFPSWNCVSLNDGTIYYTKPTRQVCRVFAELNIR